MKRMLTAVAVIGVMGVLGSGLVSSAPTNFRTHLSGDEEVPPRDTNATGQATLWLNSDGSELICQLIFSNIDNVIAAHIHLGPEGENGPIVAFLYGPEAPGGGPSNGVRSLATITDAGVIGPLEGDLDALIEAIEDGNAYVNVHTNDGVGDINTGPGDFPGGEIRGQID